MLHQIGVLSGPEKVNQDLAFAHRSDFLLGGRAHLEDDVGSGPERSSVGQHLGTHCAISLIAEVGGIAGTRFDGDRKAQLDELFDHIGHGGHALFQRKGFPWDADALDVTTLDVTTLGARALDVGRRVGRGRHAESPGV
ncbi:hypothetical protein SDC9_191068 [bioreactor metagenome]|uniref:Uncharacterized protein n=1 Tax=bioreactor metagenome TaxID=1076179 RepID=A0A645HWW5_9ZZZZ